MTIAEVTSLITTVGFPIFVAVFFMLTTNNILKNVGDAVAHQNEILEVQTMNLNRQSIALERILEKLSNIK